MSCGISAGGAAGDQRCRVGYQRVISGSHAGGAAGRAGGDQSSGRHVGYQRVISCVVWDISGWSSG